MDGIDISPVAVDMAKQFAAERRLDNHLHGCRHLQPAFNSYL